jgi:hypothetical protein
MNALGPSVLTLPSHVPPSALAPVLEIAERQGATGRDVIVAAAVAMEVSARVGTSPGGLRATTDGFPLKVRAGHGLSGTAPTNTGRPAGPVCARWTRSLR